MNHVPEQHMSPEDDDEVRITIGSLGPDGITPMDLSDLPREAREALAATLAQDPRIPEALREGLVAAVRGADGNEQGSDDDGHEPGCGCQGRQIRQLWKIIDATFPDDPHLWNAMEALLMTSRLAPITLDDDARLAALNTAMIHLAASIDDLVEQTGDEVVEEPQTRHPATAGSLDEAQIDAAVSAFSDYLKRLP